MEYKDYYKIMGLERGASQDEIKRAYRKLARKYHPDVSKEAGAEGRFKEIGEAYEVLKDPEKRAAYDKLGANWKAGQEFHPPPGWDAGFEFHGGSFTGADVGGFSDFFEQLFGGRAKQGHFRYHQQFDARGQDQHARVEIGLEDAFHGITRTVTLQNPQMDSEGRIQLKQSTLKIKIPKGIKEGQQIRLAGQGAPGYGSGAKGDLYLEVHFKPHYLYHPEGRDLYMELPVAPWEAALGASVKVPTPLGKVDLKIPPGSNSGNKLRLKGLGIPGDPPGDIYLTLQVVTPEAENEQARQLYQQMAQQMPFNPRAGLGV